MVKEMMLNAAMTTDLPSQVGVQHETLHGKTHGLAVVRVCVLRFAVGRLKRVRQPILATNLVKRSIASPAQHGLTSLCTPVPSSGDGTETVFCFPDRA